MNFFQFVELESYIASHEASIKPMQLKIFEELKEYRNRYVTRSTSLEEALFDQLHRFGNQSMRAPERRSGGAANYNKQQPEAQPTLVSYTSDSH